MHSCNAEYLTKMELEEKKESEEFNAKQDFDRGVEKAKLIPQLVEKLSEPGQMLLYYCGILEILAHAVTDSECSFLKILPLNKKLSTLNQFMIILVFLNNVLH